MSIKRRQQGLTLVELIMFIVIISIAVIAVLQVMGVANRLSADPVVRKQAIAIAEGLLEEVELAQFTYCDPSDSVNASTANAPSDCAAGLMEDVGQESGSTLGRPFDNVNDYVTAYGAEQYAFNSGGVLADATNSPYPVSGFTATLRIVPEGLGGIPSSASPDGTEVLHIFVTVYYGNGESVVLDGFRTRHSPQSIP
ncbi:prepilin-type N-terminal cleavage/methylation domain-containing protein [Massilia sp. TS11]|uniref:prepilin-type N-terminal cleavage/methylation domain-containing protein n=1 Tax=Massilia sp. TS11 TaxID=2908003 RepID=UPI001EDA70FD|nr:prepilin-type N-terminal cleavage/methylation domain-containing protein [Massilia sp. TS11]MCG2584551.1 prepilin-type N-terminal cleavage/methylation domain-containing protein [Massilia sp. TS11]